MVVSAGLPGHFCRVFLAPRLLMLLLLVLPTGQVLSFLLDAVSAQFSGVLLTLF